MEEYRTLSQTETIELAERFAREKLRPGSVVALYGELGSGKTNFVKGVCKAFNVLNNISSPSFTIINEYKSSEIIIYHFDFFRILDLTEILEIGFDDYIYSDAISLIEWADKVEKILPPVRYNIYFYHTDNENERIIKISNIC